jgi:hypothetical protein
MKLCHLRTGFLLDFSSTQKMKAICSNETSVHSIRPHGIISQREELFITTAVRISYLTKDYLRGARKEICRQD